MTQGRDQSLSVKKAIKILRVFTHERPDHSLADIVRDVRMPRTVCYRLLSTLEADRLLERCPNSGRYRLGLDLFALGSAALARSSLRGEAAQHLSALAQRTGDATCMVVEHNLQALCTERIDGNYPIQFLTLDVGRTMPLHCGGAPFALFSFLSAAKIEAVLAEPLEARTAATTTETGQVRRRIEDVRQRGYAVGDEDAVEYVVAVGAPVFGVGGEAIAAISVGGLKQRYSPSRIEEVAHLVREAAANISQRMGFAAAAVKRPPQSQQAA